MRPPDTANWIRLGLLALPLYGVLTFWSSLDPHPTRTLTTRLGLAMSPPITTWVPISKY